MSRTTLADASGNVKVNLLNKFTSKKWLSYRFCLLPFFCWHAWSWLRQMWQTHYYGYIQQQKQGEFISFYGFSRAVFKIKANHKRRVVKQTKANVSWNASWTLLCFVSFIGKQNTKKRNMYNKKHDTSQRGEYERDTSTHVRHFPTNKCL